MLHAIYRGNSLELVGILKELCKTHGYIFFDVYEKYIDEKGYLNPSYSDGNCHIHNPIFMIEKLKELTKDE